MDGARGGLGEVHANLNAALGGVSAHAGCVRRALVSSARSSSARDRLLNQRQRELMMTDSPRARRVSIRWASCSPGPGRFKRRSVVPSNPGAQPASGTSLWIDPDRPRVYVLLTNRSAPEVQEIDMNAIRRGFTRSRRPSEIDGRRMREMARWNSCPCRSRWRCRPSG